MEREENLMEIYKIQSYEEPILSHSVFTLTLFVFSVSCTKLELPDEVDKDKTDKGDTPTSPSQPDDSDVYSIASLQAATEGESVLLKGYIVGYVPTSSINKTYFSIENAVQTNIVLADSPQEGNHVIVQLYN